MFIVAFGHEKEVGKDTAATALMRYLKLNTVGKDIRVCGFAYQVKLEFYKAFKNYGVQPPDYYDKNYKEKDLIIPALGMTYREGLIRFANAYRSVYPDYWRDANFEKNAKADVLIIPDLRFRNEFTGVHDRKGLCCKITRTGFGGEKDGADEHLADEQSWDHLFHNNEDVKAFTKQIIESLGPIVQSWILQS